jgi:hypothetical protein
MARTPSKPCRSARWITAAISSRAVLFSGVCVAALLFTVGAVFLKNSATDAELARGQRAKDPAPATRLKEAPVLASMSLR